MKEQTYIELKMFLRFSCGSNQRTIIKYFGVGLLPASFLLIHTLVGELKPRNVLFCHYFLGFSW